MTLDMHSGGACGRSLDSSFVLIVDDRTTARSLLIGLVRSLADGITVEGFSEPGKALERAIEKTPDLVITDYQMPGMNGIEFIEEIRSTPSLRDIPVVMVTMADDHEVRPKALNAGASDFLTRPIDPIDCQTSCRNLLLHRRSQKCVIQPDLV